jgi:hypothetical protein
MLCYYLSKYKGLLITKEAPDISLSLIRARFRVLKGLTYEAIEDSNPFFLFMARWKWLLEITCTRLEGVVGRDLRQESC